MFEGGTAASISSTAYERTAHQPPFGSLTRPLSVGSETLEQQVAFRSIRFYCPMVAYKRRSLKEHDAGRAIQKGLRRNTKFPKSM